MTLLSLIGHQAKVTNCIRSRFCKYKPGCGVSHNSNHRAAELVTRAIPQLSQETEHFCRSVNKSCEDCPVWGHGVALMQGFTEAWAEKDKVW